MKRVVCVLAALILILCCFSPASVVLADNGKASALEGETAIAENEHKDGSFSDYLSKNSSASKANESIIKELKGVVLKSEPVSFKVSVVKSGFYFVSYALHALIKHL